MITDWPALMSRSQAAEYLSIGFDSLARLIADGSVRPVMLPGNTRDLKFRRVDLDRFIDRLPYCDSSRALRARQELTEAARRAKEAKDTSRIGEEMMDQAAVTTGRS